MKLTSRFASSRSFITIKVDEIETMVFEDKATEVQEMIENLLDVAHDLSTFTNKSLSDHVEELGL